MAYYNVCPNCGVNLDPGESCDCERIGRKRQEAIHGCLQKIRILLEYQASGTIYRRGLCKEAVYGWLEKRSYESDKTFSTRNGVYRQFYSYLLSQGDDVLPAPPHAKEKLHGSGFTPYIFTHDEI